MLRMELKYLEGDYKRGLISAEEYYAKLKAAKDAGLLTQEEFQQKAVRAQGSMFDNFKMGLSDSIGAASKWADAVYNIGNNLIGKLADGFYNLFEGLVLGSEDAGTALKKFFSDILKWMGQILIKQTLISGMGGLFGGAMRGFATGRTGISSGASSGISLTGLLGGGGGSSGGRVAGLPVGAFSGGAFHGGGVVGAESKKISISADDIIRRLPLPKFHNGLKADEILGVLKKGETVFTRDQMKQLGDMVGGTTINVPVSIAESGQLSPSGVGRLKTGIEDTVRKIMAQEMR